MASEAFLKLGTIQGGSLDTTHKGWIALTSLAFGIQNTREDEGGTRAEYSLGAFTEFTFSKGVDEASPKMMVACAKGEEFKEATIELILADNNKKKKYLEYKLSNVRITSVKPKHNTGERVSEEFTVSFKKIEQTYFAANGQISGMWAVTENTGA